MFGFARFSNLQELVSGSVLSPAAAGLLLPSTSPGTLPHFSDLLLHSDESSSTNSEISDESDGRLPNSILGGIANTHQKALWRHYSDTGVHQVLSADFIAALVEELGTSDQLLELGAGNGILAHHLKSQLPTTAALTASDDHSSSIPVSEDVQVLPLGYQEALESIKPDTVVVSWMPPGIDMTASIRSCPTVKKYILIGEADSSTCGDAWATWGVVPKIGCKKCDFEGCGRCDLGIYENTEKPWGGEWRRRTSVKAEGYSLCRFDSVWKDTGGFSKVVVFERC
jgi:hypothetical protein